MIGSATADMIIALCAYALDILKIFDIRQFTDYYLYYMAVLIFILLVFQIFRLSREKKNFDNVFIVASVIILLICSLVDIVFFFNKNRVSSPNSIMIGTLIYVSVYALITLKDMHDTYSRDRATGLYNRNKCNEIIRYANDIKSTVFGYY